jgi:hypothetical protein
MKGGGLWGCEISGKLRDGTRFHTRVFSDRFLLGLWDVEIGSLSPSIGR